MGYGRYVQRVNGSSKSDRTSWMSGGCCKLTKKSEEAKKNNKIYTKEEKFVLGKELKANFFKIG